MTIDEKEKEQLKNRWAHSIELLQKLVNDIAWTENIETGGYCSQNTMHAIIHVNQARDELKQCIDILNGKYEKYTK